MIKSILFTTIFSILFGATTFAENLPANNCQIYIRKLQAMPSSHGYTSLAAIVKVNWLGNDEHIQKVGFYAMNQDSDLGNDTNCSWYVRPQNSWYILYPTSSASHSLSTEYGEYLFQFNINSGSVAMDCPGYTYTTKGTFFVETNKNTYWLNPDMDSNKLFYFDINGYHNIAYKGGIYSNIYTDREDMKYYNPLGCH